MGAAFGVSKAFFHDELAAGLQGDRLPNLNLSLYNEY